MLFCAVSTREKKHTHAHTLHCCRPCTMDNAPAYGHIPCRQHATLCHARTCSCFPFQPRNHPATQIDTNKTHLVPLALLSPGVGGGATCAHAICAGRLWGVWESVMESAVWYWDAGHGKRREDMFCGGECVMGSASTSDAKSNQDASLCGRTLNFTTHLICEVHDLLHSTLYNTKHLL